MRVLILSYWICLVVVSTPLYCYANRPRLTLGFGGGGVSCLGGRLRGEEGPCRHNVLFCVLEVGWGNFNPVGARWRREAGGLKYHPETRRILNLQGETVN